eukprot:5743155-Amphidinium_carterae.1
MDVLLTNRVVMFRDVNDSMPLHQLLLLARNVLVVGAEHVRNEKHMKQVRLQLKTEKPKFQATAGGKIETSVVR